MKQIASFAAILIFCSSVIAQTTQPTTRPVPQIERALIVSIDGLRPDLMVRADTPTLRSLLESGSYSLWAETTPMAITMPSHTSMLTGVTVERHGITFNDDRSTTRPIYPNVPTIFEFAKKQGLSTALVAGKIKFVTLARPGSVDFVSVPDKKSYTCDNVAPAAVELIQKHRPQVMALHFADVDGAGHSKGWGSPEQIAALQRVDAALGVVLKGMKDSGVYDSTFILISADHGGAGRSHGKDDVRSRHIPWIAVGPGIRKGLDLTSFKELTIHTEDTFATASFLMGIPVPDDIDGKAIQQILEVRELLQDAPAAAK